MDVPEAYRDFWSLLGVNAGYVADEDDGENTWLNAVIPAWQIIEVLDMPELRAIQGHEKRMTGRDGKARASIAGGMPFDDEPRGEEEIARLRDDGLRRALNTPPKPRKKN